MKTYLHISRNLVISLLIILYQIPSISSMQIQYSSPTLKQLAAQETTKKLSTIAQSNISLTEKLKAIQEYLGLYPIEIKEAIQDEFYQQNFRSLADLLHREPIKKVLDLPRRSKEMTMSPTGTLLAIADQFDNNLEIYAANGYEISQEPIQRLEIPGIPHFHVRGINIIEFSKHGRYLMVIYNVDNLHGLLIWEVVEENVNPVPIAHIQIFEDGEVRSNANMNDEETLLAFATGRSMRIYDVAQLRNNPNYEPQQYPLSLEFIALPNTTPETKPQFNKENTAVFMGFTNSVPIEQEEAEEERIFRGDFYLFQWKLVSKTQPQLPTQIAEIKGVGSINLVINESGSLLAINSPNIMVWSLKKGFVEKKIAPNAFSNKYYYPYINFNEDQLVMIEMDFEEDKDKVKIIKINPENGSVSKSIEFPSIDYMSFDFYLHPTKFELENIYSELDEGPFYWQVFIAPTPNAFTLDQMIFLVSLEKLYVQVSQGLMPFRKNIVQYVQRLIDDIKENPLFITFDPVIQKIIAKTLDSILKEATSSLPLSKQLVQSPVGLAAIGPKMKKKEIPGVVTR